jgi:uncharacterized protein
MHFIPTGPDSSHLQPEPDSAGPFDQGEKPFMENRTQDEELRAHLLSTNEQFRTLAEQHAQLKHRIEEIESKSHVTEEDEFEEQRLKKLKLHAKDQMLDILEQYKHQSVH